MIADNEIDRKAYRQTDKLTDRQTDRRTETLGDFGRDGISQKRVKIL